MNTFTAMAEEWIRKNMPLVEQVQAAQTGQHGMAHHDHEAWSGEFAIWMKERCAHREGKDDWGGIGPMLVDFGEWAVTHHGVPCTRLVLEALLRDAGFHVANGMVQGLVLLADLLVTFPDATAEPDQGLEKLGDVRDGEASESFPNHFPNYFRKTSASP